MIKCLNEKASQYSTTSVQKKLPPNFYFVSASAAFEVYNIEYYAVGEYEEGIASVVLIFMAQYLQKYISPD